MNRECVLCNSKELYKYFNTSNRTENIANYIALLNVLVKRICNWMVSTEKDEKVHEPFTVEA